VQAALCILHEQIDINPKLLANNAGKF